MWFGSHSWRVFREAQRPVKTEWDPGRRYIACTKAARFWQLSCICNCKGSCDCRRNRLLCFLNHVGLLFLLLNSFDHLRGTFFSTSLMNLGWSLRWCIFSKTAMGWNDWLFAAEVLRGSHIINIWGGERLCKTTFKGYHEEKDGLLRRKYMTNTLSEKKMHDQ